VRRGKHSPHLFRKMSHCTEDPGFKEAERVWNSMTKEATVISGADLLASLGSVEKVWVRTRYWNQAGCAWDAGVIVKGKSGKLYTTGTQPLPGCPQPTAVDAVRFYQTMVSIFTARGFASREVGHYPHWTPAFVTRISILTPGGGPREL
jgi:hypothetical protein